MTSIPFEKYHGLGNDFVIVRASEVPAMVSSDQMASWCDRHLGIGADGVLVVRAETSDGFSMTVVNADGSQPEICGNGIRCAVRSWGGRGGVDVGRLTVLTGAGPKRCELYPDGRVAVEMGPASLDGQNLPVGQARTNGGGMAFDTTMGRLVGLPISVGNPHVVFFADGWSGVTADLAREIEHDPRFPDRTNVEFATVIGGSKVVLRVWERGVGFTNACGSGACAAAAAAVKVQRCRGGAPIRVCLPGGDLHITVSPDLREISMVGPAERVFVGRFELNESEELE